jgi:type II restriction enzyme
LGKGQININIGLTVFDRHEIYHGHFFTYKFKFNINVEEFQLQRLSFINGKLSHSAKLEVRRITLNINLDFLEEEIVGKSVPVATSGQTSGHAAGEPFDVLVFEEIRCQYPGQTFRQYEYLNKLFEENLSATTIDGRNQLISPEAIKLLLARGNSATRSWSVESKFDEKQNDTADIIVDKDEFLNLLDVKTYDEEKKGQAPNIISAYKIASMCKEMIESNNYSSHDFTYIQVDWKKEGDSLEATSLWISELFKSDPEELYINWAAAMQIQFHVSALGQDYRGDIREWCLGFIRTFVSSAQGRVTTMEEKFVEPFQALLN